ncbi:MAG: hypothetical protein LBC71_07345 [Oscillospiraceae bacterium]|jgi:hypothetical protein|nr:hypothetical protein [Oscillospiraceae bacterium]
MFMGINELKNAKNLANIRIRDNRRITIWLLLVFLLLLGSNLSNSLAIIFNNSESHTIVRAYNMSDNSTLIMFGLFLGIILMNCMYRYDNAKYVVFPQTNNSRFLAFNLNVAFFAVITPLMLLLIYLIQYGVISLITTFRDNVFLVYEFNILFMLTGTVVMIVNASILAALINFIATILRRFGFYAGIFLMAILVFTITNYSLLSNILTKILFFYTQESSVWLFFLKGIATITILFFAALVINKYTLYYKTVEKIKTTLMVIICIILVLAIFTAAMLMDNATQQSGNDADVSKSIAIGNYNVASEAELSLSWLQRKEIEIDISHLEQGSSLSVVFTDNSDIMQNISFDYQQVTNIQGNTVVIDYMLPFYVVNGINVNQFAEQKLTAWLDENTLHIEHNYTPDLRAILTPMFGFMRQFDYFSGRNLVSESFFSSGAHGDGYVWISIVK